MNMKAKRGLVLVSVLLFNVMLVAASYQGEDSPEKRRFERLKNGEGFNIELQPHISGPSKSVRRFRAGGTPSFDLTITNVGVEMATLIITDGYDQTRPQLKKDGEEVGYQELAAKMVAARDKWPSAFSETSLKLETQQTYKERVDLGTWYEKLDAGSYELIVRHRFVWGGAWLETSPITFVVTPTPR